MTATIHVIRSSRAGRRVLAGRTSDNLRPATLSPAMEAAFVAMIEALPAPEEPKR